MTEKTQIIIILAVFAVMIAFVFAKMSVDIHGDECRRAGGYPVYGLIFWSVCFKEDVVVTPR